MIIGIDASRAVAKRKTGTEIVAEQIIYHLSKIDHDNQYILFSESAPEKGSLLEKLPKNFKWRIIPFGYLWTQVRLSWEMLFWKDKLDILFVPSHTIPIIHPQKTVVTIHDFGFEYSPELYAQIPIGPNNKIIRFLLNLAIRIFTLGKYGNSEYDYHRFAMHHAIDHATNLIAVSKFTKNDAVKLYHANPDKIAVIYHGFNKNQFKPLNELSKKEQEISENLTKKFKPYLFFVGRIEKKKNIMRLLKAFVNLKKEKGISEKLVLAGMPGLGYDEIKKFISNQTENIQKDIIELGYVAQEDLPRWFQNAQVYVFPTLFEGFGIPVIEAFASGTSVVCSNTTSLPEISQGAAILVNPKNINDISTGIYKIINDKNLKNRLIKEGLAKSKQFSWEKAARQTLEVIKKTIND